MQMNKCGNPALAYVVFKGIPLNCRTWQMLINYTILQKKGSDCAGFGAAPLPIIFYIILDVDL